MKITDLFVKPIGRPINGVIKADQRDPESIWQELDEYVVTKQITDYLRRFFDAYLAAIDNPGDPVIVARMGVWVSGFFGSGKSHFIKILSYLLSNLDAQQSAGTEQRKAIAFFESKIKDDPLLLADMRRAINSKTDVVLFNIDSKADSKTDRDAILQVFLRVFNEMQGLSGDAPHIAAMERHLIEQGAYPAFKAAFQAKQGNAWEQERDAFAFRRDAIVHALCESLQMSAESAAKYFDNARQSFKINIDGFAELVRKYLDSKGAGQRVVFLIDEAGQFISKNPTLMLNLQTITEDLGKLCQGRAWVIVTSQEDMDATLGEINQAKSNDFSKITGRFHTRLSLSSSNTDEVIAKRLLEKNPAANAALEAIYQVKGDILNNQISFSANAVNLRGFKNAHDFAVHYPFPPYQFQLLQKIFDAIRVVGATGRHLARGERSMLDAFQTAVCNNGNKGMDVLVPLYDFYPSIESFLDSAVKRAIDQANDNAALEPYDIKLLRALFMVRYVSDTVKASVENLATLCLDQIDADKLVLKRQIAASLDRLEKQNLVSRNGEFWFFLTNEERDVAQEIKAVEISLAEVVKTLADMLFEERLTLGGQTKVRHRETKSDYEFNRLLDGAPWKQASHELSLEIISPLNPEYNLLNEARCIGRSAESSGRAIVRMASDERIDLEIRRYCQIEKYIISPKAASPAPSLKQILANRKDENRERKERLLNRLGELMVQGDFYVLGQKIEIKSQVPSVLLDDIINNLISNTYTKLTYIKVRQSDPLAEIRAILDTDSIGQQSLAMDGESGNAQAMDEMRRYLKVAAGTSRILLADIVEKFTRAPWGWKPEGEIVLLIARLFMAGEIKLVLEGTDLEPQGAKDPLTKAARYRQVSILWRKVTDTATRKQAHELHRELFSLNGPEEEDGLVRAYRNNFAELREALVSARGKAEQKHFPGAADIATALARIDRQIAIRDPFEFLGALANSKKEWLELNDDTHDVLAFYKTQSAVWARMLEGLNSFDDNREALNQDAQAAAQLATLEAIRANTHPYGQISSIEPLVAAVEAVNHALAAEYRAKALLAIEQKLAEVQKAVDDNLTDTGHSLRIMQPLQELKVQLAGLLSIPRISFLQARGGELLDQAMNAIAEVVAVRAKAQARPAVASDAIASTAFAPPLPLVKPIKVIKPAELSHKSYLENEAEVEEYVEKLRAALLAAIAAGQRARIQ